MKRCLFALLIIAFASAAAAQAPPATPTLKSILLSQLKATHDQQDWFEAERQLGGHNEGPVPQNPKYRLVTNGED